MPAAFFSKSNFVGGSAKGVRGMILSVMICCPAAPNLVVHWGLNAWRKAVQLS